MRLVTFHDPHGTLRTGRLDGEDDDVRVVELSAPTMLDWLRGDGHAPTGRDHALGDVLLLAPIPEPPSVRDFYAYEEHVATGSRLRGRDAIPQAWYAAPTFYFSNPASIQGPGTPVRRPAGCEWLDLELEIAAVIGEGGEIAGFTLLNDWSARDLQRAEMEVGLGPAKGKDFATSIGPWLVTPDELPMRDGRLRLTATASLNGEELIRTDAGEMYWSWPQLVAHAAKETRLRPGDVLGSGTLNRGCLLELNADGGVDGAVRWLAPGDDVTISADGLGTLRAPIV
ncbi:MAG TPA: fumarylacetoacetate hydrolase family protein [Baekduia sp.]|uniref:fumarylacetoacetate hydrolase family protein n=1 Tax=Baekduia sp. TaxID=2600305 RepID=UPI002C4B684A|nr:fumarylacetoacetate hydrolase family protein [Baekduia sp.]HMJ33397.1 fumarylacetoacetate hydrolase family protein [Baekduia sp.]